MGVPRPHDQRGPAAHPRLPGRLPHRLRRTGNYSLGIREQIVFPEIDYGAVDKVRPLQVNIVSTARTDAEGRRLLELLGMPFERPS